MKIEMSEKLNIVTFSPIAFKDIITVLEFFEINTSTFNKKQQDGKIGNSFFKTASSFKKVRANLLRASDKKRENFLLEGKTGFIEGIGPEFDKFFLLDSSDLPNDLNVNVFRKESVQMILFTFDAILRHLNPNSGFNISESNGYFNILKSNFLFNDKECTSFFRFFPSPSYIEDLHLQKESPLGTPIGQMFLDTIFNEDKDDYHRAMQRDLNYEIETNVNFIKFDFLVTTKKEVQIAISTKNFFDEFNGRAITREEFAFELQNQERWEMKKIIFKTTSDNKIVASDPLELNAKEVKQLIYPYGQTEFAYEEDSEPRCPYSIFKFDPSEVRINGSMYGIDQAKTLAELNTHHNYSSISPWNILTNNQLHTDVNKRTEISQIVDHEKINLVDFLTQLSDEQILELRKLLNLMNRGNIK